MSIINPTLKYKNLLIKSNVISKNDECIIDPLDNDLNKVSDIILLQQGHIDWDLNLEASINRIKFAITPNLFIYKILKSYRIKTSLIEFPIEDEFRKITNWNNREDAIYYHGRIIPGKINIEELISISNAGIKIVIRGPICKAYWTDIDIEKFAEFKEKFLKIVKEGKVQLLEPAEDIDEIITDLNKYKFYFTLSEGEAFNIALEEAIACGTIPLVRKNEAYWWADKLIINFTSKEKLIKDYKLYVKDDLEEYSQLISNELKKRNSFKSTLEKFKNQNT